jgi:hypothetical protein
MTEERLLLAELLEKAGESFSASGGGSCVADADGE